MAALRVLRSENSLYEELILSPSILGKRVDFLYDFLSSRGISSLSEITVDTLKAFISHSRQEFAFSPKQFSAYKGDLETICFAYLKSTRHPFTSLSYAENAIGRKALTFLYALGITSLSEITADTRKAYEEYLELSVPSKVIEYIKYLDRMVLSEIEKITFVREPAYENKLFYLVYYPDIKVAKRFYYTARKEFLFFDFSLPAPILMKKQIFRILLSDLSEIENRNNHYMVQHFITPLYYLYDFCVKNQIPDLKQITLAEEKAFYEYLDTNMDAISKNAPQVLYRARRFLFLSDKKPDFTATCWFLERFTLSDRKNPTRGIECFTFGDISEDNRTYFQHYMKYLLVLSPKYSLQSLHEKYYGAKEFIRFIESRHATLSELSYSDIESFIEYKDQKERTAQAGFL